MADHDQDDDRMDDDHEGETTQAEKKQGPTQIPMARVKRIAKADPDIKTISSEALFLISRATELFIEAFAKHSYEKTAKEKRKVIQYRDLARTVSEKDEYEFLNDIIPEQVLASSVPGAVAPKDK